MAYRFIRWAPLGLINGLNKYGLWIVIGSLALGGLLCRLILKRVTNGFRKYIVNFLYVFLCVLLLGFYVCMGWMPLWLIRLLSEHGRQVVIALVPAWGALIFWLIRKHAKDPSQFPWWIVKRIVIPFFSLSVLFLIFYAYEDSNYGFQIKDELFKDSPKNYYYVGRVKGGKTVGKGLQFYSGNERLAYSGGFKESLRDSRDEQGTLCYYGTLYYYDENGNIRDIYIGRWADDEQNGQGMMKYANGDVYKGNFVNGLRQGQGRLEYANGDIYEGNFVNGECHDKKGALYFDNGDTYVGNFENGVRDGQGKLDYAKSERENREYYDGPWTNDKASGAGGTMKYVDGNIYKGDFVDGKRQGQGVMEHEERANDPNNNEYDWYDGEWENDMRQGHGKGYDSDNGTTYDGEWKEDKRDGTGVLTLPNGESKKARFSDGEFKEWL